MNSADVLPVVGGWYPVATLADLNERAIFHTQLQDVELVVWRSDEGQVNVWENRCVHRGVRLSIGMHLGHRLKCRYHGWEYDDGSARCSFVPSSRDSGAHPSARVKRYAVRLHGDTVWTSLSNEPSEEAASLATKQLSAHGTPLRRVVFYQGLDATASTLLGHYASPSNGWVARSEGVAGAAVELLNGAHKVTLMLQPASTNKTYVHGLLEGPVESDGLVLDIDLALTALANAKAPSAKQLFTVPLLDLRDRK